MESKDGLTILVIEDEPDTQDMLSLLLRRQGYRVKTACDGSQGLIAAQEPEVALVLLDVMLPDLSGFDVCLKIKERRPQLPVIIVSVRAQPIDTVTGLDCGSDDYISKPFASSVFLARIRAALRARLGDTADVPPPLVAQSGSQITNVLLSAAQPLDRLLQPQAIGDAVIKHAQSLLTFEKGAVCIWQEKAGKLIRAHVCASDSKIKDVVENLGPEWDQGLYKELKNRQPILIDEQRPLSPALLDLQTRLDTRIAVVAPISNSEQLSGALVLSRGLQPSFSASELDAVACLTCQAGIALEYARWMSDLISNQTLGWRQLQHASEFLSTISHELRTPVAAIKGFITTLLSNHRYWNDQEREDFLENVNASVDQLSQLLENVLEMGQIDKGVQIHRQATRLSTLVQRVFHNLSFQPTRCQLVNETPNNLPTVVVAPLRIERVLRNLLENALKFSPQGGQIRVFAQLGNGEIVVGVEDQGIGISPEHLPHIFEKFYQVDQTGVHKEGIGLGLYISRKLIRAHGGRIWAESELGHGTTVYFALPCNGSPVTSEHALSPSDSQHSTLMYQAFVKNEDQPGHRANILIVEDDAQLRRSIETGLKAQGFGVMTTSSGSEAIELIQAKAPHLILLDLRLPDIDGLAVCQRVRQFSDVPIIIITAQKNEWCQVQGLTLGADDYLIKPFSHQELLARVRAVLRRTQIFDKVRPRMRLHFESLEIDPICRKIKTPHGRIQLTPTEHRLLYYLASNAGHILTHEQLLTRVWGYECEHPTAYLWVNISRLRKKIELDPEQPRYILTEPGIGYRFEGTASAH